MCAYVRVGLLRIVGIYFGAFLALWYVRMRICFCWLFTPSDKYACGGLLCVCIRVHNNSTYLPCDGHCARAYVFVGSFPPVPPFRRVTVCAHAYVLACYAS